MGLSYLLIKKILYIGESVPRQNGSTLQGAFILSRSLAVVKSHSCATCAPELLPQAAYVASFMTVDTNKKNPSRHDSVTLVSSFLAPLSFSNLIIINILLL